MSRAVGCVSRCDTHRRAVGHAGGECLERPASPGTLGASFNFAEGDSHEAPAPRRWRSPVAALLLATAALSSAFSPALAADTTLAELRTELQVGDLVFIRVPALPFRKVAAATNSWTNHVGVVVETAAGDAADVLIAESTFPRARRSTLARFVARSEAGRVAVMRRDAPLTEAQGDALRRAADARMGIAYDTGFDLHSPRQFCSRFAREVIEEATGDSLGEVETSAASRGRARPSRRPAC